MARWEEDSQEMNTYQGRAPVMEPSYVRLWNTCFLSKSFMRYLGTTPWLTGLNCSHTIHYPVQPLPICGRINTTSRQIRFWSQEQKETGARTEIIPTFMVSCLTSLVVWQICTRDGQS